MCVSLGAILHFSGGELAVTGPQATAGIFATYLPEHMTLWWGFLNEVSGPGLGAAPQGAPQKPGWETVPRSVPAHVYVCACLGTWTWGSAGLGKVRVGPGLPWCLLPRWY